MVWFIFCNLLMFMFLIDLISPSFCITFSSFRKGWERTSLMLGLYFGSGFSSLLIRSFASVLILTGKDTLWFRMLLSMILLASLESFMYSGDANGAFPTSISYNKTPSAHRSKDWSWVFPFIISGAR